MTGCSKEEAEKVSSVLAKETVTSSETESDTKDKRPNVLLIVADDLGFNDISLHGSEIQTPNIDQLIKEGVFFSDFHVAPNCSPTRAMLLSGTDNHIAGLGNMAESLAPNQLGRPGYEGHLNFNIAALPELFQDAGYHTYMTGKWHLGLTEETSPTARGFEKSFILAQGGAGAFSNMLQLFGPNKAIYRENGKKLESLPEDFYSTQFYTDRMIEYIDENKADDKPFFSYLAYTSPHWPLQALRESIEKYSGVYDDGYEALKQRRFQSLKDLGLIEEDAVAFPRFSDEAGWDTLSEEEKKYQARLMEIYAAMVNDVDVYIGKLIEHLKAIGEYDNTFIFFLADNGPEAHNLEEAWEGMSEYVASCCDNSYENIGSANSYVWYGQNWGQAGNTPRRMYKGFTTQGGVQVPAFAHYPKSLPQGLRNNEILHVMDVMPTLLELAGIEHPGTNYRGRDVAEMKGESMLSMLTGKSERVHNEEYVIGWELFSKRAVRKGDWKIVYEPFHKVLEPRVAGIQTDKWQLYNLAQDPIELNDLSETHSEKLAEMIAYWDQYVADSGLVIPDSWEGY
ncbi:MAG: sulfatase-like hydrolase/transferase [Gammaproteobacteria bacterium]|nr:sulfatase-like hydrolase/transferase [Gammaproteobacteria bacterium]